MAALGRLLATGIGASAPGAPQRAAAIVTVPPSVTVTRRGCDLTLHEVNDAAGVVVQAAGEEANVIFGAVIDPNMDGEIVLTVVATGFGAFEPRLKLIDKGRTAAEGADDDYRRPQAWRRGEERRAARSTREDSLEVPTFLRKQMD